MVLLGTDGPELDAGRLAGVRRALRGGVEAALVPAPDGGDAALGLRRVDRRLFDGVPWGTGEVLAETRARLAALGWAAAELAPVLGVGAGWPAPRRR